MTEKNMLSEPGLIGRKTYCESRLSDLAARISSVAGLPPADQLCVYVCGSYGRMEASRDSDLDVFLMATKPISDIDEARVKSELIKITRDMGFAEFSNDGEYLSMHCLEDILDRLGSPADDYYNHFTARMLLLLESRPLYGDEAHKAVIQALIEAYYRDQHDHEKDFRPVFLLNDLVRFWKTFCLNYEHRRNGMGVSDSDKAKLHLKNLKLKYSRLLTCFSMVLPLVANPSFSVGDVVKLAMSTPLERLSVAVDANTEQLYRHITAEYAWFLDTVQGEGMLQRLQERSYRDKVFSKARDFGREVFSLLEHCASESTMRYLVM